MNNHVAVYTESRSVFEQLQESFDASFILSHNPAWNEEMKNQFIICDLLSFEDMQKNLAQISRGLIYVISPLPDDENMRLIEKYELRHLVGQNDQIFGPEIFNHLKKQFSGKLWGLSSYLDEQEATIKILSLSDSKFTNEMMDDALGHFDFKDYFASPVEYLQVMANELISNSLYKGPKKKRLEHGIDNSDRKSPVFLKGSELVQVTVGMDNKGVALSVQDSFGGLNYEILTQSLKRSFEEKTVMEKKDGAGLGLYLTFLHSNQFIINFRENFRTEVICIIDKNKRYKNYKQRIRSFHFFQEGTR